MSNPFFPNAAPRRFISPKRERVPQQLFLTPSKWKASLSRQLQPPVIFDYLGYTGEGVPLRELGARSQHALAQMIIGAHDLVLQGIGMKKITFHIKWPGYDYFEWRRPIELYTSQGPLTRGQLGAQIAAQYQRYCETAQFETTNQPGWAFGPCGVTTQHLILLALWNVCDDVWQAEIAIDMN